MIIVLKLVLVHMGEFKLSSSLCGSNLLCDDLAHTLDVLKHLAGMWWYLPATGAMPVWLATRARLIGSILHQDMTNSNQTTGIRWIYERDGRERVCERQAMREWRTGG